MVQRLRLCDPNAGGPIPSLGLRFCMPQLKITHATTKSLAKSDKERFLKKRKKERKWTLSSKSGPRTTRNHTRREMQ